MPRKKRPYDQKIKGNVNKFFLVLLHGSSRLTHPVLAQDATLVHAAGFTAIVAGHGAANASLET